MGWPLFPTAAGRLPSTAPVTDVELVECARRHDGEAWAELVQRHHVAVYRTAYAALLRHAEADDAAQEAWMTAWQRLDAFRGDASFRTWIVAIAWHKALDRRRSLAGWMRRLAPLSRDEHHDTMTALVDTDTLDAETTLLDREARGRVRRALRGIPAAYRDCLLLAAGGELTCEDIGRLLGMPTGTVKWRVSEARKRLRTRLEGLP
jgi:RNA polymerase sigma-70 factor (ECF subfamily)